METTKRKPRAAKSDERKAWEREQRINRLVDIVQELFFTHGYDGTTVEDIARAAGYTKRSIYLYFKDRDDLFLAVAQRSLTLFKQTIEESIIQKKDSNDLRIINVGRAFYRFSLEHPEHFNILMTYETRLHRYYNRDKITNDDSFQYQCQALSGEYGNLVTSAIEEDIKNGHIKTNLTARQLMLLLWGQIFGIMQIILMRKASFHEAYGIKPELLFEEFLTMAVKSMH